MVSHLHSVIACIIAADCWGSLSLAESLAESFIQSDCHDQSSCDGHLALLQTASNVRRNGIELHAEVHVEQHSLQKVEMEQQHGQATGQMSEQSVEQHSEIHGSRANSELSLHSMLHSEAMRSHQIRDAARSIMQEGQQAGHKQHFESFTGQRHKWIGENGLPPYSSLHDVVGKDGVLMITLDTKDGPNARVTNAVQGLITGGIYPTPFPATNGRETNRSDLDSACKHTSEADSDEWCSANEKIGMGCRSAVEQAVTDSHRRAIEKAGQRKENWTLIIEDDVVPLTPDAFSESFAKAWVNVPDEARIVRLGWCTFEIDHGPIDYRDMIEVDDLQIVTFMQWTDFWQDPPPKLYYAGGCTTGYMVHKDIVPEVLGIFPCCCPIDCCLEWHVYYAQGHNEAPWDPRGHQVMVSLDINGSRSMSQGYARFNQSGLLVQDNRGFESTRPEWNSTETN